MTRKVAIIYWGSRGGGPRQLLNLVRSVEKDNSGIFFYVSSNNELLHELQTSNVANLQVTRMPHSKLKLLSDIPLRNRILEKVLRDLEDKEVTRVYFLLPHPWDLHLARKLMNSGKIQVWRGIHDLRRHPGDIWPNVFTIKKLIRDANSLVCFSNYVEKQLLVHQKPVIRSHLFEVSRESKLASTKGSVLFVGRIRKYKGLDLLAQAWTLVVNPKKSLIVAGDGKIPEAYHKIDAKLLNKWLTNTEIEELVRKSNLVVLPYVEASQSGVVAIAHSLSTPVVVTPVGGLSDQVMEGINGLVAAEATAESLAASIDRALSMDWALEHAQNPLPDFMAKLQTD